MSVQNGERLATKQDLADMYQEILPYLGGSADAGFTPVGSVIAIMGVTAPANYLACNGQIVNVADYPELANYFEQQFGTKYKFGGSGTTFGIPDLRGEFLRGTGTNGHTNQGSGADVGVHQDATVVVYNYSSNSVATLSSTIEYNYDKNSVHTGLNRNLATKASTDSSGSSYSVRPTNTSILWCIATKDIYLNPSMDYSTSEKVVGKWIDGKPLYQKTVELNYNKANVNEKTFDDVLPSGIENVIECISNYETTDNFNKTITSALPKLDAYSVSTYWTSNYPKSLLVCLGDTEKARVNKIYVTVKYTKTT